MSWVNELYNVYELVKGKDENLIPLAHSTANAQIEVKINERGEFCGANIVDKEDARTVIPVTDDSSGRTSDNKPMPLADKLFYIAGDYTKYATGEKKNNEAHYKKYIKQLTDWKDSQYSHIAVCAIHTYLSKKTLMHDLIKSEILQTDESGRLVPNGKINNIPQEESFIRFIILYNDLNDLSREIKTWQDETLQQSFLDYINSQEKKIQLCYALGKELPVIYKHPKNIVPVSTQAKLISANDKKGFTFRGRFADKEEAVALSVDFSQKMHAALKWLISKQGQSFDNTHKHREHELSATKYVRSYGGLTLVTWASSLQDFPNELSDDEWDNDTDYDSLPNYRDWLKQYIMNCRQKMQKNTKIMIMGLEAATPGRLSISLYDELASSVFLQNLEEWHTNSAWIRYNYKEKKNIVKSFSLYEIIKAAYGKEDEKNKEKLILDDKLLCNQLLRLLPCVMKGQKVPNDLIFSLYNKASNPLAYDKKYNHDLVIEVTCGMLRARGKGYIDGMSKDKDKDKEGEKSMAYDPNVTDRSYLYGCLLAVADKIERDTYEKEDKQKRITNARRYWNIFSQRPFTTWRTIEERLQPYINRSDYKFSGEKSIEAITDKFTPDSFQDDSRLSSLYLLGYHHYMAYLYSSHKKGNEDGTVQNGNFDEKN